MLGATFGEGSQAGAGLGFGGVVLERRSLNSSAECQDSMTALFGLSLATDTGARDREVRSTRVSLSLSLSLFLRALRCDTFAEGRRTHAATLTGNDRTEMRGYPFH